MTRARLWTLGLVWALAVGCGRPGTGGGQDGGSTPPLSQCVVGWWLGSAQGCDCPSQPECAQSDCQAFAVYGFAAGGTAWQGLISVSKAAHTVSSEGAGEWDPYQVQGASKVVVGTGGNAVTLDVSCETTRLQVGYEAFAPAPSAEAKALDTATAGGQTSFSAQTF